MGAIDVRVVYLSVVKNGNEELVFNSNYGERYKLFIKQCEPVSIEDLDQMAPLVLVGEVSGRHLRILLSRRILKHNRTTEMLGLFMDQQHEQCLLMNIGENRLWLPAMVN
jgi:hypothetical protein